ncbi:MAG: uroporphyrinogen-III synthase [Deltaproteobacteria bacterium]|nr:uroporphyrinogen-III synthase [Deltaproteobacteria bacterium]
MAKTEPSPSSNRKPLSGRRIVITRARSQASAFARALEGLGAEVVEFPTIEILPPTSYDPLDQSIREIHSYHWIIFTSVNGVAHFFARWQQLQRQLQDLKGIKVAAIGPETAKGLESVGLRADLVPQEFRAEAILGELKPDEVRGKRILLPRAAQARDVLPNTLRQWGAEVDVIEAYRTVAAKGKAGRLEELVRGNGIDMITFTSSSTVSNFAALFSSENLTGLLSGVAVACIGPITQKTAEELAIRVDVVSQDYTIPGLTRTIAEYFERQ